MARRTRFFRDIVNRELVEPNADDILQGFHEAFQTYLIGSLSCEQFADLYAQTVTYGLFAARTRSEGSFNRRNAYDAIPHTIGILRDVFRFISLEEPPEEVQWIVDDIAHCLSAADPGGILERYFQNARGNDPNRPFLRNVPGRIRSRNPGTAGRFLYARTRGGLHRSFGEPPS
jgi:hypothetical protein